MTENPPNLRLAAQSCRNCKHGHYMHELTVDCRKYETKTPWNHVCDSWTAEEDKD